MRSLMKMVGVLAVAIMLAAVITHLRPKVPRAALAIAADETHRCEAPKLPVYPTPPFTCHAFSCDRHPVFS